MRDLTIDRVVVSLQLLLSTLVVAGLIIGLVYLANLNRQTQDTLKLLSCIVLITPEDRIPDDVEICLGRPLEGELP